MRGAKKVIVFCTLISILPCTLIILPLYLRHIFYADIAYAVTESDIMEINDGISTIFCSEHTLRMNTTSKTFNAFQVARRPEITSYRKHIRLKKSMSLPDDTLEYWGFYLLKNATVSLSVCSRFQGASLLVVKGEKNLHTCGLLDHNINKEQPSDMFFPNANRQVKIIYESDAQEIHSNEITTVKFIDNDTYVHKPSINRTFENSSKNHLKVPINRNNSVETHTLINNKYMKNLETFYETAVSHIVKHAHDQQENINNSRKLRHIKGRKMKERKTLEQTKKNIQISNNKKMRLEKLKQELDSTAVPIKKDVPEWRRKFLKKMDDEIQIDRVKRSWGTIKPPSLLDQGIKHGGNADKNFTSTSDEVSSSVSSFETDLFNCYGGAILLAHEFEPSDQCTNISYLLNGKRTQAHHHVMENGYYYYIFYSDNDIISNDIYALFDIYKPTFQYENVTKLCINQTECTFSLTLFSTDRVIVEIPTKDGIEHDETDDISILISTCQPRMNIYMIFPLATLVLILFCAFI